MLSRRLPLLLAAAALALTGCTTGSTETTDSKDADTSSSSGKVDAGAFPVTIKHTFGSTTVKSEPKRVATLGWSDQDHAAALGVVPVGSTKITYGGNAQGSTDFFDAAVEKLGGTAPVRYDDSDGIPFAEVAKVRPDLILATNSGLTQQDYDKLSKIAPVVAYPGQPFLTPWRTSLEMVGQALGRTTEAAKVEDRTQSQIDEAKSTYSDLDGKTFMLTYLSTTDLSTVGIYGSDDTRVAFLRDFGLEDAPSVLSVVKKGTFYGTVSAEKSADLEADVMLAFTDEGKSVETFAKHPLIGKIPTFAGGHVYTEDDTVVSEAITNPTPLSIPVVIDAVLPELDKAVRGS
jgi:iron complex transport system substrate-binding protein